MNNKFKKFYKSLYPQRSSLTLEDYIKAQGTYITPNIVEENRPDAVIINVFDRLMSTRQIFFNHVVDQDTCGIVMAQLLFLNKDDDSEITMYINSPGGSISDGLGLIDTIGTMASPLRTINVGEAASMGSILLAAGNKGKRQGLITSRVLLHEPRTGNGFGGTNTEYRIQLQELEICEEVLFNFLAMRCGKTYDEIKAVAGMNKDYWMSSTEALKFGIIDEIVGGENDKSVIENMKTIWDKR